MRKQIHSICRESVALYNESIVDLDSMLQEADKVEIKKLMTKDKIGKLTSVNAVKFDRGTILTVRYVMKCGAKNEPRKVDGIVYIRTQREYKIMPNEVLKIDMGVKFQTPKHLVIEFTPQNAELKKLGLLTRTGFLEIGMRDYMTLSVQNMTEKEIILPEGQPMCRVELAKVDKDNFTKETDSGERLREDSKYVEYEL